MFAIIINFDSDKKFNPLKKHKLIPLLILLFLTFYSLIIHKERMQSEITFTNIYRAQMQRNMRAIVREAKKVNEKYYIIPPQSVPVEHYKAVALSYLKQHEKALISFQKAYEQHPYQLEVLSNYGTALTFHKKFKEAEALYRKSIEISPRYIDGNLNLAIILHNQAKYDEAYDLLCNIDYEGSNDRYKHIVKTITKQKLLAQYNRNRKNVDDDKLLLILKNENKLLDFHRQVLNNNNDFDKVFKDLTNK